ncbi:putative Ubiquitin-like domain-containing protein [Helianthus annuus]|nr:putative Ubiquitin-like domain-containing protein [Helianthus annuus]
MKPIFFILVRGHGRNCHPFYLINLWLCFVPFFLGFFWCSVFQYSFVLFLFSRFFGVKFFNILQSLCVCVCFIVLVKTDTGEIIYVQVKGSDTIGRIKLKIHDKQNIPFDQQELVFNQKVLENNNTLANFPIKNQSTLTLMRKVDELMEVFVNTFTSKTISLLVKPTYTITKVKTEIEHKEGVLVDEQVLIFDKMVLGTAVPFSISTSTRNRPSHSCVNQRETR